MEIFERIASVLSGSCSLQDKKELDAWRKKAPANEKEYCRLKKIWEAAVKPAQFKPDADLAWKKVNNCIFKQESPANRNMEQKNIPLYRKPFAIAAAVALLVLGTGYFLLSPPAGLSGPGSSLAAVETKAFEKQSFTLPDGSRIWLNENSILYYPEEFEVNFREVKLKGEAYFEVAHQPEKPFIIRAGAGKVQVLGTSFNLEAKEQVKIQVTEGRVSFSGEDSDKTLTLTAGEAALLSGNNLSTEKQEPNFMSWKTGEFVFEDSQLKEVFHTLEEYYAVKISVASSEILKCRLFARFQQQPLEEVLKVLSLTLNLAYDYEPGQTEVVFRQHAQAQSCSPFIP